MNQPPRPPVRPEPPGKRRAGGSWLAILLFGFLVVLALMALSFITLGYFMPVIVIGAIVFLMTGFHYFVWGWWVARVLRGTRPDEE